MFPLRFLFALFVIYWAIVSRDKKEKRDPIHERHIILLEREYLARLAAMQQRVDEYMRQEHERSCNRIIELSEKLHPSAEELQELAWRKAAQIES